MWKALKQWGKISPENSAYLYWEESDTFIKVIEGIKFWYTDT